MLEMVTEADITVGIDASNWEDAIRKSAIRLLEIDKIESRYVDAMIDTIHRIGPYIVLGNHVALAHARPECGAKELGICFSTLRSPIPFGSEQFDPISLIITLAATDADSHLDLMSELAGVLMEEENVERLVASKTAKEFLDLLQQMKDEDSL